MNVVKNRFMFDTSALNVIIRSYNDELLIYSSKLNGFEYYFTEIQNLEAENNIKKRPNVDNCLVSRNDAERATKLLKTVSKLQTKYVGLITAMGHWKLDGTYTLAPDSEKQAFLMYNEILNSNDKKYYNDAMIALSAITYGCIIVTEDNRLYRIVNKWFKNRAIKYNGFIKLINN